MRRNYKEKLSQEIIRRNLSQEIIRRNYDRKL